MALLHLPNEILLIIGRYIDSQNALYSLVRTCRRLHTLFIHTLYRFNITRHNFSALPYLSEHGQEDIIRRFLAEDAHVPPQTQHQWRVVLACVNFDYHPYIGQIATKSNPLSGAAKNGHEGIIRLLLFELGVSPNVRDTQLSFPLHWAAENGHVGVAKLLVEYGGADIYALGRFSLTPLAAAGVNGHTTMLQYLYSTIIAQGQKNPVLEARNTLRRVIHSGQIETFLLLLDAVQDVNIYMPVHTPLTLAAQKGQVDIVEALLTRGADLEKKTREFECTPLISATRNGQERVICLLLAAGADPNAVDWQGCTALHYAAEAGNEAVVRLLLAGNADASFRDGRNWKTPGEWALERGHQSVATVLFSSL